MVANPHTISPLTQAEPPNTVKQLRGWLGSFKQLTDCIPQYAILLGPLEDLASGRGSAERITWTPEILSVFSEAKLLGGNFSCRISDYQKKWYPCEGEALAVKLVL